MYIKTCHDCGTPLEFHQVASETLYGATFCSACTRPPDARVLRCDHCNVSEFNEELTIVHDSLRRIDKILCEPCAYDLHLSESHPDDYDEDFR